MGGNFFSNFWKGGDYENEFGKPWSKLIVFVIYLFSNVKKVKQLLNRIEEETYNTYFMYKELKFDSLY